MTNTKELKAAMLRCGVSQDAAAKKVGISKTSFCYKANNRREFRASEIAALSLLLNLTADETKQIFLNIV